MKENTLSVDDGRIFNLLLVDDEEAVLSSLRRIFKREKCQVYFAGSGSEALWMMEQVPIDAAVVDLQMPGMDGLTLLGKLKEKDPLVKVLILTGHGGVREAVKAISHGAQDFLEKPCAPDQLLEKVRKIARDWRKNCRLCNLQNDLSTNFSFPGLIGDSPGMLEVKGLIAQVGNSDASVLIQGESGTGKELVAMAIHHNSPRKGNKYIAVDCASLGESLMQSELFGHTKGAFTGAHAASEGLIRAAHQGTLFLDEIGELDSLLQGRLLRTFQEMTVRPVGSSQLYPVNVRLVSATNRHLQRAIVAGDFREDLYYRLNTVLIEVPPLRERRGDIAALADNFIQRFSTGSTLARRLNSDALECLMAYDWPGNVRELSNVICRAVVLARDEEITPAVLPTEIWNSMQGSASEALSVEGDRLEDYEKLAIRNALFKGQNNRRRAAQILGVGEATLYRKIKKYNFY